MAASVAAAAAAAASAASAPSSQDSAAGTPSAVTASLAGASTPTVARDPVAVALSTPPGPEVMGGLETAGLAALSQLPQPAQLAAMAKYNTFSTQLRGFLKGFAEESKVVTVRCCVLLLPFSCLCVGVLTWAVPCAG